MRLFFTQHLTILASLGAVAAHVASHSFGSLKEYKNIDFSAFEHGPQNQSDMQLVFALASAALALPALANSNTNCEDYSSYSKTPHGKPSAGALGLPFMRPPSKCRTFKSSSVEVCGERKRSLCAEVYCEFRKSLGK